MKKTIAFHRGKLLFLSLFFVIIHFKNNTTHAQVSIVSVDTKTGLDSTVHPLTSVASGRLLVVVVLSEKDNTGSCSVSSSPSLTWTKRVDAQATGSGDAEIWTAVTSSTGNITVRTNWAGTGHQASVCYVISGQETTLGGASASDVGETTPSVNITTTRANSIIIAGISDWDAEDGSGRAYRGTTPNERLYHYVSTKFTAYGFDRAASSVTTYTEGLSSPASQSSGVVLYEVRSPVSADVTPPSAPTLSSPAQGSSTINLSWTTSTDDVGVTGYEIYKDGVYQTTVVGTTHQLTGLSPSTSYSIYVRAKDAAGNGTNSNTITPSTGAPTGVTIVTVSTDAKINADSTRHELTSVPAGALLVLTTVNESHNGNCIVSSDPVLTWTKRADAEAGNSGNAEIYTAVFTAGGNITVSSKWGFSDQSSVCYVVTNYEEELAGNAAFASSQSAPFLRRNTSRDSSIVFCASSDWNAVDGSSRTYRNSPTERLYGYNSGGYTYYHYTKLVSAAGPIDMGLSAPSGQSAGIVSFEVRRAPGVSERQNLLFDQDFEGTHSFDNFLSQNGGQAWSRTQSGTHENEGDSSFRGEVRSGCDGFINSGYRTELLPRNISDEGVMWYGVSIYLDEPFSGSNWTGSYGGHFIQWHPDNGNGSATLSLWGSDGEWDLVTNPGGQHDARHHSTGVAITRGWHHIVFKVNWSYTDGYVQVWIDGNLVFDLENGEPSSWYGPSGTEIAHADTVERINWHPEGRYLKVGMNRWGTCNATACGGGSGGPCDTWILYYDNVRIGNEDATYNDVVPVIGGGSRIIAPPVPVKPIITRPKAQTYTLGQNYPNPFSKQTTIPFTLPKAEHVTLSLIDMNGRVVKVLTNGWREAGKHIINVDASTLSKGIYYYQIQAGEFKEVRKLNIQ